VRKSRREFLWQSIAAAGGVMFPGGCSQNGGQRARSAAVLEDDQGFEPAFIALEREGELERREAELWQMLADCEGCARGCGANRLAGDTGVCSSTARLKVASAGPHFGEERELVGRGGSGTVFFSNCNLLCCYCQNWEINHRGDGQFMTHDELADVMLKLQRRGCHNINVVTPSHVVPHIVRALRVAIPNGLRLPLVFNTGGYDNLEVIRLLDGIVDVYLPDFKYQDGAMAAKYSSGASDYPEVAAEVIREMHRQVGELRTDAHGIATRGLIVRHLVLPNNVSGTDRFVRWVADELSPDTYVNLMAQYRPEHLAFDYPDIARRITDDEWRQALSWARDAGLENVHT
jgi:putative pyruvate formate lyase activating enzyme